MTKDYIRPNRWGEAARCRDAPALSGVQDRANVPPAHPWGPCQVMTEEWGRCDCLTMVMEGPDRPAL